MHFNLIQFVREVVTDQVQDEKTMGQTTVRRHLNGFQTDVNVHRDEGKTVYFEVELPFGFIYHSITSYFS